MNGKKIVIRIFCGILILIAFAGLVWAAGWLWSFRLAPGAVPAAAVTSETEALPGRTVTASVEMELPRSCTLDGIRFEPGQPAVALAAPEVSTVRGFWRRKIVRLTVPFAALRPGEVKPGRLTFAVRRDFGRPEAPRLTVAVPSFMAMDQPLPPGGIQLELAGEFQSSPPSLFRRPAFWITAGGLTLLAVLLLLWLHQRRKRKNARRIPPWERALEELDALRFLFEQKRLEASAGLVRLTDLVRRYLEERYGLPATTETTPEFLDSLDHGRGERVLPELQKPFLREFLQAADLVRFAKADADRRMVDRAIAQAENLVESSIPSEESPSNNAAGDGPVKER